MRATSVPDVCMAVRDLFDAVVADTVNVYIGPPKGDIPDRYVAVMYAGDDRPGVQGFGKPMTMGGYTEARAEEFLLWCTVSVATGNQDTVSTMVATNELYTLCLAAIQEDRNLAGVVPAPGFVDIDGGNFEWQAESDGDIVTCFFALKVRQEWFV